MTTIKSARGVRRAKFKFRLETQTGNLISHLAYGMIYNLSMRKQMSIDQDGVISDGTEKAYVNFNYPTTQSSLTHVPSFTERTEYPGATSGETAVYHYSKDRIAESQARHRIFSDHMSRLHMPNFM